MPKSKSLMSLFAHSLFFLKQLERFAPVALYKIVSVSNLLKLLFKKEQKCNSLEKRANHTFALSLTKNERFARKTDEWIPNPGFMGTYSWGILLNSAKCSCLFEELKHKSCQRLILNRFLNSQYSKYIQLFYFTVHPLCPHHFRGFFSIFSVFPPPPGLGVSRTRMQYIPLDLPSVSLMML